jgi:amino acid transporter
MSFSTLVATSAAEFNFWRGINDSRTIQGVVIYFLIPLTLVFLNTMRIQVGLIITVPCPRLFLDV